MNESPHQMRADLWLKIYVAVWFCVALAALLVGIILLAFAAWLESRFIGGCSAVAGLSSIIYIIREILAGELD